MVERLEEEKVDSRPDEGLDLLLESLGDGGGPFAGQDAGSFAGRPHRPRDVDPVFSRRPGDPDTRLVDGRDLFRDSEPGQQQPVRGERVRFEDVGARPDVGLMDGPDELGARHVRLVERPVDEVAPLVKHRPHGPVADEGPLSERLEEAWSDRFARSHSTS
jgi:hypothetical protein